MITKLKRNPKFDIPYHDNYAFEFSFLSEYIEFLKRLETFSGIIRIQTTIEPTIYKGLFTVDRYIVPDDFIFQLTQKTFNYDN